MPALICKHLGAQQAYTRTWQAMQAFTDARNTKTDDELWLLEHDAVFTLGRAGRVEHILDAGDIPVVQSDRGGQVTYHGPGQLVAYTLFNLNRLGISIRDMVSRLENTVIQLLSEYGITATTQQGAPGVYVKHAKIASIGLRIRRGYSYHGLSLNVCNDLSPFKKINPCGYEGLQVTHMRALCPDVEMPTVQLALLDCLMVQFAYQRRIN